MRAVSAPDIAVDAELNVEFCGEWFPVRADQPFEIGREGMLDLDDNPFLHRQFLQIVRTGELWWLCNIGSRLSATITDGSGGIQAWLSPGSRLPIVFGTTFVIFTAGPTTYELSVHFSAASFESVLPQHTVTGATTIGVTPFTASQRLLIIALCEPMLRREGTGTSVIPSSAKAAARLGWSQSRFNRKLDNVCEKLDKVGVRGVRGDSGSLATHRRARLVEYAVSSHLVTRLDLPLLDAPQDSDDDDGKD
ncbi:hypothetical protein HQQ81_13345 [Microbacteriaceae bacterium VKM Ac-2854]|nr:hypothetical protein [Microbacteriaceae bacterium VKM Ac-2854]